MTQREKADAFRALHHAADILVLPNAWDAASAVIFERTGFPAIATTSAGVAFSQGYADGQRISLREMLHVVERIVRNVNVPVTADMEAGYDDPVATAVGVMEAGGVGMNFEDRNPHDGSLVSVARHVEAIQSICARTNILVNARTDVFLSQIGEPESRVDRAVERMNAYLDAGAGSVFAPGPVDAGTIRRLAQGVRGPLNILAVAGTPPIAELQALGVARVTIGSGGMRATMGLTRRIANELFQNGTYAAMTEDPVSYPDATRLFMKA